MRDSWIAKPVQLKFALGEMPLFSITFSSLVLNTHFTKLTQNPEQLHLPFEKLSSNIEALLIRSHPIEKGLERLSLLPQVIRYVPTQYRRYYIDLQGSFSDYLHKFSSKSRSTLIRKVRKFAELSGGEICWREFRHGEEMLTFYQLARELSKKTYQERLLDAGLPDSNAFQRDVIRLAAKDLVRGYLLFLDGRPLSYLYCPIQEGILFYQHLGYDPEFRHLSPGTVLQYLVLERLFAEERFCLFDFTEGEGDHKKFFSTGCMQCADIYYFRRTFRNLLFLGFHSALSVGSDTAVTMLNRVGLKTHIKKFFRSRVKARTARQRDESPDVNRGPRRMAH